MKNSSQKKKVVRSWFVTIIAGMVSIASFYAMVINFTMSFPNVLISIALFFFTVLATMIAYEGKKSTLRELFNSSWYLP